MIQSDFISQHTDYVEDSAREKNTENPSEIATMAAQELFSMNEHLTTFSSIDTTSADHLHEEKDFIQEKLESVQSTKTVLEPIPPQQVDSPPETPNQDLLIETTQCKSPLDKLDIRDCNFYVRGDIREEYLALAHECYQMQVSLIENEESEQSNILGDTNEEMEDCTTESESTDNEIQIPMNIEIPISSLTYKQPSSLLGSQKYRAEISPAEPPVLLDPFEMAPDYPPANIGPAYQCVNIPDVLTPTERKIREQRQRYLEPCIVFQPPPNAEEIYASPQFNKMLESLKDINPHIPVETLLDIYYDNNYDEFATISYAAKNQNSLVFSTKDCFTQLEKNLFEIGLLQFGKDFVEIQQLIKTKTLEEVCTYYYYWKSKYSEEFQKQIEENTPAVQLLRKGRAKLILERLERAGEIEVNSLSDFFIDVDSDWVKHELYPYIPDPDAAYIHVKDKAHLRAPDLRSQIRKRASSFSDDPPTKYSRLR